MKKAQVNLSTDDALILQQISESGEEDVKSLSKRLGMQQGTVMASLHSLRRKGLISIKQTAGDLWVNLSLRGKQLTHHVWPEMKAFAA